jgi:ethanolamine utilization protein EutN
MYLARVVGTVVAPVQHPFYHGRKILLVRRTEPDGKLKGPDRVAVDRIQAGVGDWVLVLEEGSSARDLVGDPQAPVRTLVVGYVDEVELDGVSLTANSKVGE